MDLGSYYYEVKTWDNAAYELDPARGRAALERYAAKQDIAITGVGIFAYKDIRSITETTRRYVDPARSLPGVSTEPDQSPLVGRFPNSVQARFVKRQVPRRVWDKAYANRPGYHLLQSDGIDVLMGWTHVVRRDGTVPDGAEYCTVDESQRLAGRMAGAQS